MSRLPGRRKTSARSAGPRTPAVTASATVAATPLAGDGDGAGYGAAKKPSAAAPAGSQFRGDVANVVQSVRRRLAAVVESVCGGRPRAQDITDTFGIYRKLGWQIWNVVYADDPLAAIRHLPNPRTLRVWHEAMQSKGISGELIARLDEAIAQFHRSVKSHADDREMLEMLVESNAEALDEASAARWRKQAFTGNAYTWGVRAKCMLACAIIFPSATRDAFFDMVRVQGLIGLVRTRPGVRWPFAQLLIRDSEGKKLPHGREPLTPDAASVRETGVPLLEEFCSRPLPRVQRVPGNMGMVQDELLPGEIGQSAAADVVTGEILREVSNAWADEPGHTSSFGTGVRTPTELLVSDQLVHRDLYPGVHRELHVFGELMTQLSRDERDRIPVPETVQHLGRVSDGISTADVPRHGEMLARVMKLAGLNPDDFEAYRVRMRYPPLPVSVIVRHEMPVRPQKG